MNVKHGLLQLYGVFFSCSGERIVETSKYAISREFNTVFT